MAFGDYDAKKVYQAARVHMDVSPFFPTIADIKKKMIRGELVYGTAPAEPMRAIPAPKNAIEPYCMAARQILSDGSTVCPFFNGDMCYGTQAEYEACTI
jgi:hypothetical protein